MGRLAGLAIAIVGAAGCRSSVGSPASGSASASASSAAAVPSAETPSYAFRACPAKARVVSLAGWMTGILEPLMGPCVVDLEDELALDPRGRGRPGRDARVTEMIDELVRDPPVQVLSDSAFPDRDPAYGRLVAAGAKPHIAGQGCSIDGLPARIRHLGAAVSKLEDAIALAERVERDVAAARAAIPADAPRPSVLFVRVNFSLSPSVYGDDCMREMLRLSSLTDASPAMNGFRAVEKGDFESADVIVALTHVARFGPVPADLAVEAEAAVRRLAGVDAATKTRARLVVLGDWTVRLDARVADAITALRGAAVGGR